MPSPLAVTTAQVALMPTHSCAEIAEAFGCSERTIQRRRKELKKSNVITMPTPVAPAEPDPQGITAESIRQRLFDAFGTRMYDFRPDRHYLQQSTERIVVVSDLHVPYHREDLVAEMCRREQHQSDLLIVGGDLSDSFGKSRYVRYKQHFSDEEEFRAVRGVLEFLALHFRHIIIMRGNHDERLKKWLHGALHLSPGDVEMLNYLARTAGALDFDLSDPISALAAGIPGVEIAPMTSKDFAEYSFFYQHDDLIVSHAERFSKIAGRAGDQAAQWFRNKAIPQGIAHPFRVLLQAHTHQHALYYGDGGVWIGETGCLARTPDYDAQPKLMGAQRPPALGYFTLTQNHGITDVNSIRWISLN